MNAADAAGKAEPARAGAGAGPLAPRLDFAESGTSRHRGRRAALSDRAREPGCAHLRAPFVADHPIHSAPNLSGKIKIDGKKVKIMQASTEGLGLGVTPIGPTGAARYFLGADTQGRDVAARLYTAVAIRC